MPFMPKRDCRCCLEYERQCREAADYVRTLPREKQPAEYDRMMRGIKLDHCKECWRKHHHDGPKGAGDYEERGRFK